MTDPRILTIQDISCVGQCSLTVALPILSACGIETAILPSAVLSTHTAGFTDFTFRDLSDDMPSIAQHWVKEGIQFDAIYTGYLGSLQQIDYVKNIAATCLKEGGKTIIDPAMADNGALYSIFDMTYAKEMKTLCDTADIILPNITEACFMTDVEYKTDYDKDYIMELLEKLSPKKDITVVLTGVSYTPETTGVVVYENGEYHYYEHQKISKGCHGTGDIYASAFTGALLRGNSTIKSAQIAADYVVECIKHTQNDPTHWYGVKFEAKLPILIQSL